MQRASARPALPAHRGRQPRRARACCAWAAWCVAWACAAGVAQGQERAEATAQAAMPLVEEATGHYGGGPLVGGLRLSMPSRTHRELLAPSLSAPCKIGLELEDQLKRFARMTHEGVEELLQLRRLYHQKTAALPLFEDDALLVSSEYVSWNLLGGVLGGFLTPAPIPVVFGPYIQNWQSARKAYEGHYGVRLQLPW